MLVLFWYAPILVAMADAERDEPWQRLNPLPLLFLFAVLAVTARWLPPREPGFADRVRRSLVASVPWTVLTAAVFIAFGRRPAPPDFVEGVFQWLYAVFLYWHGWPILFVCVFYTVEHGMDEGHATGEPPT